MVVDEFDVGGPAGAPGEADAPLVVDADAVLAGSVAGQFLQSVTRRYPQVIDVLGRIDEDELVVRESAELRTELLDVSALPDRRGVLVAERADHQSIVTPDVINGKRYYCGARGTTSKTVREVGVGLLEVLLPDLHRLALHRGIHAVRSPCPRNVRGEGESRRKAGHPGPPLVRPKVNSAKVYLATPREIWVMRWSPRSAPLNPCDKFATCEFVGSSTGPDVHGFLVLLFLISEMNGDLRLWDFDNCDVKVGTVQPAHP